MRDESCEHMDEERTGSWTLLTGHGHVLVEVARDPDARVRDLADRAGLTERTVHGILADLEAAGYITRQREGRRNSYTVNQDSVFRHSSQGGETIRAFLALLTTPEVASDPDD
jgi:DNA-binding MarR family transcriptional regulator